MKESHAQASVNTLTSVLPVLNPTPKPSVGEIEKKGLHLLHSQLGPSLQRKPEYSGKLPTPINPDKLAQYLVGYDESKTLYLLDGFRNGFRLEYEGDRGFQFSSNLKSALEKKEIVSQKISKELSAGRIAGPFSKPPFNSLKISPLGIVPKKTPNQYRMIHHLSYPTKMEGSVNAGISDEAAAVQYAGINDAVGCIKQLGETSFCCKTDIRSAFRILPVSPMDYELLGFMWEDKYFYDKCLPMGCRTSCKIFEQFSTAIEWIAKTRLGITAVVHILDDFLFIEQSKVLCLQKFKNFLELCVDIGIPLAAEKTVLPTQIIEFVGIEIDVRLRETRLPRDKILKCTYLLQNFLQKDRCTVKEMQSLIGVLNFACSVILPGRAFLRHCINVLMKVSENQSFITIDQECKQDMFLWLTFLEKYNGKTMFLDEKFLSSNILQLYTDAAQSKGFAGIYKTQWFYGSFPENWKSLNIMTLEFYPIVLAVAIWGRLFANHSILFFTDNEALVSVINKLTSKDSLVLQMVRYMVMQCLEHNIIFKAKHIPGKHNKLADSLSRLQVQEFRKLAPDAQAEPTMVPAALMPQNFWTTLQSLQLQL
ncbi:uncharacterized protein LOC133195456 isoform X1 [Saccostrea echinata]|uniref:uncharacterized protein LOC133195456 isoform X1 n=1 Tax=Saccostrea echinata TaxID=191078 RepID=UPI002A7F8398|nr:uncharacterized protein LOC133195456 isoform X1 [Saccostrea echinata]